MSPSGIRVGLGTDRHAFEEGGPLVLAGVEIPHHQKLAGHSDADAVLHAVCDALLGALGLGDIGEFFPDTDPQWKGVGSEHFLKACLEKVLSQGWNIGNVDVTIHTEQPKISPHRQALRDNLAYLLDVSLDQVSIKAKTAEKLGPVGEKQCLDVQAIILISKTP